MSSKFLLNFCTVNRGAATAGDEAILPGMSPRMVSIQSCCLSILRSSAHCSRSSCLRVASSSILWSSRSALRFSASKKVLHPGVLLTPKSALAGVEKVGGFDIPPGVEKLEAPEV